MFLQLEVFTLAYQRRCPITAAFDSQGATHLIYCGSWSCPVCMKRNAALWSIRAQQKILQSDYPKSGELWFLTLTLPSTILSTVQGFLSLPSLWDTTRKQYQRWYGTFSYLAFVEGQPHRSHMPHFHILTSTEPPTQRGKHGFVTKHGLHDWAFSVGWGFQAELHKVDGIEAAAYVAKYASKQSPHTPKGFRRVRVSRDWPKLPPHSSSHWIVPARQESLSDFLIRVHERTGLPLESLYIAWSEVEAQIDKHRTNMIH